MTMSQLVFVVLNARTRKRMKLKPYGNEIEKLFWLLYSN